MQNANSDFKICVKEIGGKIYTEDMIEDNYRIGDIAGH